MKLSIGWKSRLEVFDAVGTVETYSENRNDIIELLKYIDENGINKNGLVELFGNKEISYIVVERVIEYLRECGYINSDNLSIKGRKILESGRVPVEQRGKFRFWNIENLGPMKDMYSNGSKLIIGYRRQKDTNNKYIHRENSSDYKKLKVTMPNSNEEFRVLSLSENQYSNGSFACIKQQNQNTDIQLKLGLSSSDKIELKVNGDLRDFGNSKITVQNNTVFSEKKVEVSLSYYIINILSQCELFSEYDSRKRSFKLNNIKNLIKNRFLNESDLENFTAKVKLNNITIGDAVYDIEAENIPIMPGSKEDADFWFYKVMENKVSDNYINDDEFDCLLNEIASRAEFEDYIDYKLIDKSSYINNLRSENKVKAYWNLQAPRDLKLSINNMELIIDKIDIPMGTIMSMEELINKLIGNNKVNKLIFSSKYIIKDDQRRKFEIFIEALRAKGCNSINLITQHKFSFKDINIQAYDEIYGSRKNWPHDRYFSLEIDGIWHYYKMSAELDQCKFPEEGMDKWSKDLQGKWKDISFYKLDRNMFPLDLLKIEDNR